MRLVKRGVNVDQVQVLDFKLEYSPAESLNQSPMKNAERVSEFPSQVKSLEAGIIAIGSEGQRFGIRRCISHLSTYNLPWQTADQDQVRGRLCTIIEERPIGSADRLYRSIQVTILRYILEVRLVEFNLCILTRESTQPRRNGG